MTAGDLDGTLAVEPESSSEASVDASGCANAIGISPPVPSAGRGAQRRPARALHGGEDGPLVAETDLTFGRMHVDVEGLRRDVDT